MQQTGVVVQARDAGEALRASLANVVGTFVGAIPRIIGFAIILIAGWFIASLIGRGVAALLHAVKFNELAQRSGFGDFVQKMGVKTDSAGVIASLAKWFVRLIVLVAAFDQLGLPAVSQTLNQLLLWLPNLIVALVVLVIGGLAATALSNLARGAAAEAGFTNPDTLANVARIGVWSFAIVVAVNQLGIATTLINTLLIGIVGALALASGLAFGLGGRDRAAQLLDDWSRKAEQAAPKLARAADAAERQAGSGRQARPPVAETATLRSIQPSSRNRLPDGWIDRSARDRRSVNRVGPERRTGTTAS